MTQPALGRPRTHYRSTDSTNLRARELVLAGAPHGTLVTAGEQSAGRGRQGRTWTAPPNRAVLMSVIIRDPPRLLSLIAGLAVAEACTAATGAPARIKWPNDVLSADGRRKLAGILVEGRPQEGWAVLGIGVNVAVDQADFPPELADRAGTLGLQPHETDDVLQTILERLARHLAADERDAIAQINALDALRGQPVHWAGGSGTGAGIAADGSLTVIDAATGHPLALDAGEVHLGAASEP
jgi:BirA family biotin operon repressor/biotin-[acetyl-CoA-carboxylase] ligase